MSKAVILVLSMLLAWTVLGEEMARKPIPTLKAAETVKGVIYKADRYKGYHLLLVPQI